jgi:hypothetical protein
MGRLQFTALPIDINAGCHVSQIGMSLNGVVSTGVAFGGQSTLTVYAPASAEVQSIEMYDGGYSVGNKVRLHFQSEGHQFVLDKLSSTSLSVGQSVLAGMPIGSRGVDDRGRLLAVTLAVYRVEPLDFFARPERYPSEWLHADDPLGYFIQQVKAVMVPLVSPPERNPLSFDVLGTLQGQWFHEALPYSDSVSDQNLPGRLWFYYSDETGSREYRIMFPGPNYEFRTRTPQAGFVDPKNVTLSSGVVTYRMEPLTPGGNTLILLVQMLPDGTVKAESFDTYYTPDPRAFTSKARIYKR